MLVLTTLITITPYAMYLLMNLLREINLKGYNSTNYFGK